MNLGISFIISLVTNYLYLRLTSDNSSEKVINSKSNHQRRLSQALCFGRNLLDISWTFEPASSELEASTLPLSLSVMIKI